VHAVRPALRLISRNRRRYGGYVVHAAVVLLAIGIARSSVAMELDELVRLDLRRPRNRQELLPLVAGVIRGG